MHLNCMLQMDILKCILLLELSKFSIVSNLSMYTLYIVSTCTLSSSHDDIGRDRSKHNSTICPGYKCIHAYYTYVHTNFLDKLEQENMYQRCAWFKSYLKQYITAYICICILRMRCYNFRPKDQSSYIIVFTITFHLQFGTDGK